MTETLLLTTGVFVVAFLYSCVGHAGASGYIAWMALMGVVPAEIRPTALALNVLVASLATWQFAQAGHFSWPLFWPFAIAAVPAAYLGGQFHVPGDVLKVLLGLTLLFSAFHFARSSARTDAPTQAPDWYFAVAAGAVIGLLSGITGTGGGIFLTPLLLMLHWAQPKQAAAVTAPFVLLTSVAGLLGLASQAVVWPAYLPWLLVAAGVGGFVGSRAGSVHFPVVAIKRLLAAVLLIASAKLLFT